MLVCQTKHCSDGFVEENMGLVHLCARRFSGKGVEYEDLFQAGCVGLVKAAEHFDWERGVKFSTYAVPVILGEIRLLFRVGRPVRVSRGMQELGKKAREAEEAFREKEGTSPTVAQVAKRLSVPVEKAALALGGLPCTSCSTPWRSGTKSSSNTAIFREKHKRSPPACWE